MEELDCSWTGESYSPGDFVDTFSLPRVVKLLSPGGGPLPPECLGEMADVRKPFLLYSQRRRTKGYARHMVCDSKTGGYMHGGLMIEIPKDYAGFFEIIPNDPRHAPVHFSSIRDIEASRCKRFLVRTVLGGFMTSQLPNGDIKILSKHMIYPGEVLQRVRVVTKRWRLKSESERPEEEMKRAETRYLLCTDLAGQEVSLPLAHPGTFCALYDKNADSKHFVWKADEILTHFRLPVSIRLVFGWPPKLPDGTPFSGVLQVIEKRRPDTLVLYNFQERAMVVGELPLDMEVRLQPATNQQEFMASETYRAATKGCDHGAYCYVINMKVLDVDYRHLMNTLQPGTLGRRSAMCYGMMSSALDMSAFNIRDIFPPVDEKGFTSAWPITFRDPIENTQGDLKQEEEDAKEENSERQRRSALKRNKSLSGLNKKDALDDIAADLMPSFKDARRSRVEEADNREAQC